MERLSLIPISIGAVNRLMVGLFQIDLAARICGGQTNLFARIICSSAGLWSLLLLFRPRASGGKQ